MDSLKDTYISAYAWLLGICERNFTVSSSFQFSYTCVITDILSKYVVLNDFMAKIFELRKGRVIKSQTGDFDDVLENLNKFGVDLTAKAREGKLAPVIGRGEEIQRMIQILVRKTKNNPILLGEPGVGKTAVVEALAQRIARNEVPFSLQNKRLISLDTTALVAGAGVVGELEERMKGVIKEVIRNQEIILFIDEIHTIVGAGAGSKNNNDIANILKPALARGELRTIGATTLKEYRLYFEKDPALQRRFQPVNVNEPSVDEALAMLRGVRDSFELYHNVNITDNALIAAVRLSKRYINDRFLPDKAVDLIDEAAAELKTELESEPNEIARIKRNIQTLKIERKALKMEEPNSKRLDEIETKIANADKELARLQEQFLNEKSILNEIAQLKLDADTLQKKANLATIAENIKDEMFYSFAMLDKRRELRAKNEEWEKLQKEGETLLKNVVTDENIARIISRWTQIPVQKMLASERQKFLQVEDYLKKSVIGQDAAMQALANVIKRSKAGLNDENKPLGSFLFLGPTGVGKTQSAKALAKFLFDDEKAMIRFDMSEYMEKQSVQKLLGAPPGYVGHEDGGQLTEKVRRKPYSVVLFDEAEKAHQDIFNVLLSILDDGRATDSKGVTVDFKNTIIILTSNIASQAIIKLRGKERENAVKSELKAFFKPEFLNRFDDIITFNPLGKNEAFEIVKLLFKDLQKSLENKGIKAELSENAALLIAKEGFDEDFGARPLKRAIYDMIENRLSAMILKDELRGNESILIDAKNNEIAIEKV